MAEIAVTLTMIGLVLALGLVRVDSLAWDLDTAGQQVVQRLRAARAVAVLRQHDVVVIFDVEERGIVVHEDADNDGVIDDGERVMRHGLEGGADFSPGSAPAFAGFTDGAVTFEANTVTFLRNGSASQEGAVYVSRPNGDKARIVVVNRATGYADMYRYNGSTWLSEW